MGSMKCALFSVGYSGAHINRKLPRIFPVGLYLTPFSYLASSQSSSPLSTGHTLCSNHFVKMQGGSSYPGPRANLPEDIWLLVFKFLVQNGCTLSSVATVSREWQRIVERYNFALIKLTPSRLADFNSMTRRCRALVDCIWFCLELDQYDCSTCASELSLTREEHQDPFSVSRTNMRSTRSTIEAFQNLFAILSTWESNGDLKLDISFHSPSDSQHWFKYLTFVPDTPSITLDSGAVEREVFNNSFHHDPQHGWIAGSQHSAPPSQAILKLFQTLLGFKRYGGLEFGLWHQFPLVPAVTSVVLRQQNRRRWDPDSLALMLTCFPRLQEIHYEPWRGWDSSQDMIDERMYC